MPRSSSNRVLASLSTNDFDLRAFVFHAWRPAARRDCCPLRQAIPAAIFVFVIFQFLAASRRAFQTPLCPATRMLLARLA